MAATLAVVLVSTSDAQQRRWFELYDEAIQHIRRSEWSLAETKLKQAQRDGPAPGRTVLRYGMLRDDFFPDFYLGVVYLNTDRPKEALQQFQVARTQKLNAQDREFVSIGDLEIRAQGLLAGNKPIPPTVVAGGNTPTPVVTGPPPPPPVNLEAEQKRLAAEFEQAIQRRNLAAAREALLQFQKVQPDPRLSTGYSARISTLEREIRLAVSERAAMRAFFAGDYRQAVNALDAIEQELRIPLSARGYFYRACGLAGQALRSAQVDNKILVEARRQYAEAMKNRELIAPDRRFVSPRILQALGS